MRRARGALVAVLLVLTAGWSAAPAPAYAAVVTPVSGLTSATNGIALGSDGNLWVAEEFAGSVAKVSPSGAVLGHVNLGGNPTNVTAGPNGTVWVTDPSLKKVFRIVVADSSHTETDVSGLAACEPIGIADGGDSHMYLSFPACGTIGRIPVLGGAGVSAGGFGDAYDLVVTGGKLFVPDQAGDAVRRVALGPSFTVEATLGATGGPGGITAVGGTVYVTLYNTGHVGRFSTSQASGTVTDLTVPGIAAPFGITPAGAQGVLVTGKDSRSYAFVDTGATQAAAVPLPADSEPWQVASGPAGDFWIADQQKTRILHVVDGAPTGTMAAPRGTSGRTASVDLSVDTHGNDTTWQVQYGTNTAYGKTVSATIGAGSGAAARSATLTRLKGGKTYHVRLVATNARGVFTGPDATFKMPRFAPGKPSFKSSVSKAGTVLTSLKVSKLAAGEKVAVSCRGKGCPMKKKAYKIMKKGTLDLTSLFKGKVLKPGARVVIKITAKKLAASTTTLTVQAGEPPDVTLG